MFQRLSTTERLTGVAAAIGIVSSFFTWGSYNTQTDLVTLTGFRISLLGIVFFLSMAAILVITLSRLDLVWIGHEVERAERIAMHVAMGAVAAQFLLNLVSAAGLGKGILGGLAAAIALEYLHRAPRTNRATYLGDLE